MNQQQRKYAKERATNICARRMNDLKKKHTKPGKVLTPEQRATLIRQGKVKLRPNCKAIESHTDVVKAFDFSKHEFRNELDEAKFNHERDNLLAEHNNVMDEIMLGDEKQAMELLRKFDA